MSGKRMKARVGVALLGIGAVTVASVLPGALALADETSDVHTAVTRAVLSQGDANGEISRSTLITQIQVDGSGQTSFSVPAPDGATPKDMDAFGGPTVEDGSAQYNLDVDGAQLMRTSQTYNTDDLPVTVEVSATLDGQSIEPADLAGNDGLATLTYTLTNLTAEPTEVSYEDAAGKTVTKTEEIPTPMAGSLSFVFDSSWTEITSEESDTVAQNGSAGTTVGATVALMAPPAGETQAEVTIEGRVESAVVPPADIKVAIIDPLTTGAGESGEALAKTTSEGLTTLYDGMELLASPTEGLGFLATGLGTAVTGADKIANGVADTLGPGVSQLSEGLGTADAGANEIASGVSGTLVPGVDELVVQLEDLPSTVTSSAEFKQITDGFDTLNGAVGGVKDALGVFSTKGPGQYLKANGDIDKSKTTAARTLWSLIYGVRAKDVPSGSPTNVPSEDTGGLTNPDCKPLTAPKDPSNPCGAFQIVETVSDKLIGVPGEPTSGVNAALQAVVDGVDGLLIPGVDQVISGLDTAAIPGVDGSKLAVDTIGAGMADVSLGLASVIGPALDRVLAFAGCPTVPGDGGNVVTGLCATHPGLTADLATVSGGLYAPAGSPAPVPPTGGVKSTNDILKGKLIGPPAGLLPAGNVSETLAAVSVGLSDASAGLGDIKLGLQGVSGTLGLVMGNVVDLSDGLNELLKVITTQPDGSPDKDTTNGNTATGILSELRRSLALDGAGSNGTPGKCKGYNTPGDPSSGLNTSATTDQVKKTCAAADVLNVSLLVSAELENGVSTTLLEGISDQLVDGVQPLVVGVGTLADGTAELAQGIGLLDAGGQLINVGVNGSSETSLLNGTRALADGLPAAEAGATAAASGVTQQMMPGVNSSVETANSSVAVLEALSVKANSGADIPGGAAEGVDSNQGIYAFEFAGSGTAAESSTARFGLALLLLLIAGGLGWFLASRAS